MRRRCRHDFLWEPLAVWLLALILVALVWWGPELYALAHAHGWPPHWMD